MLIFCLYFLCYVNFQAKKNRSEAGFNGWCRIGLTKGLDLN